LNTYGTRDGKTWNVQRLAGVYGTPFPNQEGSGVEWCDFEKVNALPRNDTIDRPVRVQSVPVWMRYYVPYQVCCTWNTKINTFPFKDTVSGRDCLRYCVSVIA